MVTRSGNQAQSIGSHPFKTFGVTDFAKYSATLKCCNLEAVYFDMHFQILESFNVENNTFNYIQSQREIQGSWDHQGIFKRRISALHHRWFSDRIILQPSSPFQVKKNYCTWNFWLIFRWNSDYFFFRDTVQKHARWSTESAPSSYIIKDSININVDPHQYALQEEPVYIWCNLICHSLSQ